MPAQITDQPLVAAQCPDRETLLQAYHTVRQFTEFLCDPLETEDYVVQSMEDVSPTKWHIAHVSWFFEAFLLRPYFKGFREFDPIFNYLFNSYYVSVGERHCRPRRGLLSRPSVEHVFSFRKHIDRQMESFIKDIPESEYAHLAPLVVLGLHHEQQHQELIVTDIKHVFGQNPLFPVYRQEPNEEIAIPEGRMRWIKFPGGIREIGYDGDGFSYDNEGPRHQTLLRDFQLASRLVTCGEFIEFIEDGGYEKTLLWLSDGWSTVEQEGWKAPLYWFKEDGAWHVYTLNGKKRVQEAEPATHISYYEADAFARWAGARLPTEAEWEVASQSAGAEGNFVESAEYHPRAARAEAGGLQQMFGDCWEWTASAYLPYPGFQPAEGAVGEYNGKFMCNQFVLRGGSCATSKTHIRPTYRNFFHPPDRWQFTGIRLAKDTEK